MKKGLNTNDITETDSIKSLKVKERKKTLVRYRKRKSLIFKTKFVWKNDFEKQKKTNILKEFKQKKKNCFLFKQK